MSMDKICETEDCGRPAAFEVFMDDAEFPGWFPYCVDCTNVLKKWYEVRGGDELTELRAEVARLQLRVEDLEEELAER